MPSSARRAMKAILSALDHPMVIVTVAASGERAGCLVGFSSQCSVDPPRFMVWLSKKNHTFELAERADRLAVHFPDASQKGLAELFGSISGDEAYKFSHCHWHDGPGGAPILDDCSSWFAGPVVGRCEGGEGGDHVGFVLDPTDAVAGQRLGRLGQLGVSLVGDIDPGQPA